MYRKELASLQQWAARPKHKPLIIRGARQVGKSTLVSLFAEKADFDLVVLNLERDPQYADAFQGNDPLHIIGLLSVMLNKTITAGKTLLFIDEIQAKPYVLSTLRYFYEELPDLHVIAAGSLLDFELDTPNFAMPVGRISYLYLGPMTFIEFLQANQQGALADYLMQWRIGQTIPAAIHQQCMSLLRQCMAVGGMPEAVEAFSFNKDYREVEEIKHNLLTTYSDDFAKYAKQNDQALIRRVFTKLPVIVGRKVKYTALSQQHRAQDVSRVITQLSQARVMSKVIRSAANGLPLNAEYNEKFFKVLFLDIGLVSSMLNIGYQTLQQEGVMFVNEGALAEQWVGQELLYGEYYELPQLSYWAREKASSAAELDFVIASGQNVVPIEVKAGKSGSLKSLHVFLKEKNSDFAVRFNADTPSLLNAEHQLTDGSAKAYQLLSLPLYMAGQCRRILGEYLTQ